MVQGPDWFVTIQLYQCMLSSTSCADPSNGLCCIFEVSLQSKKKHGDIVQGSFALIHWKVWWLDSDAKASRWARGWLGGAAAPKQPTGLFRGARNPYYTLERLGGVRRQGHMYLGCHQSLNDSCERSQFWFQADLLLREIFDLGQHYILLQPELCNFCLLRCLRLRLALVELSLQLDGSMLLDLELFPKLLNFWLSGR